MTEHMEEIETLGLSDQEIWHHVKKLQAFMDRHMSMSAVEPTQILLAAFLGDVSKIEFHLREIESHLSTIAFVINEKFGEQ